MCWKTRNEINAAAMTAEKDIPVFKVVNIAVDGMRPEGPVTRAHPYYRYDEDAVRYGESLLGLMDGERVCKKTYLYEAGNTYSASGFARNALHCTVWKQESWERTEGIHSYSSECEVKRRGSWHFVQFCLATNDEYADEAHAGSTLLVPGIMECVIPKGARYCVNEYGEYVSDSIRVTGFASMGSRAKK